MKNKGFTLVELLAVIAILALLVIIALPNVLKMFNQAKKDTFLTEAKTVYKEISKKYISETMRGNKISNISNDNNKLELESNDLKYNVKLNNDGSIKRFEVSNGTYCISGKFNNLNELTTDKVTEGECINKEPTDFATDTWETIIEAVREGNDGVYNVGDTKDVELEGYGKHTLRIANKSTPEECSKEEYSQTACGFVLEFVDIITRHKMNDTKTNIGGWPASSMYTFVNNDIYNSLPPDLRNGIIDTKVISSHGKNTGETNFTTMDKLYLLSLKEMYVAWDDWYDSSFDYTRRLDYYKNIGVSYSNPTGSIKKEGTKAYGWWLRSASLYDATFYVMYATGKYTVGTNPTYDGGVSPAFRIG